ncbi:MAG: isoprenylcysteine carboxylmethyltransferase family protein [Patescibacteria group bacterium]|nr:isoprenylcysteine carboxylmethyltransferase family protein [Patescibacteria group bacterium]MDE1945343.1 isoprenylcysteine carboxylmethyltransferase family protein [Patescibacteria group bacterium]MDE2058058.1 isoprenylcysteine carboxylmethyltransferase family protein [Patescibacteria group bacterium]
MIAYDWVVLASWAAFLFVWIALAFDVKPDVDRAGAWRRAWRVGIVALAFVLVHARLVAFGGAVRTDATQLFVPPLWLGWAGAACAVAGVGVAIWARLHLGRNWSSRPTMKQGHELVTTGPYRFVRHPIYTGVLLAALGAFCLGNLFSVGVAIVIAILFLLRIPKEEAIMRGLFPEAYPAYQARTKRLIPFVW